MRIASEWTIIKPDLNFFFVSAKLEIDMINKTLNALPLNPVTAYVLLEDLFAIFVPQYNTLCRVEIVKAVSNHVFRVKLLDYHEYEYIEVVLMHDL